MKHAAKRFRLSEEVGLACAFLRPASQPMLAALLLILAFFGVPSMAKTTGHGELTRRPEVEEVERRRAQKRGQDPQSQSPVGGGQEHGGEVDHAQRHDRRQVAQGVDGDRGRAQRSHGTISDGAPLPANPHAAVPGGDIKGCSSIKMHVLRCKKS